MNNNKFELYVADVESTGLDPNLHSPIEISIYRLYTKEQKTWYMRPTNFDTISKDALRVNGYKEDDLRGLTKYGKDTFGDPAKVLPEIENWLSDDMHTGTERLLCGHNIKFDLDMMKSLWGKCNAPETFPFNDRYYLDTMQIEVFLQVIGKTKQSEYLNLGSLVEKYNIKKEKAHKAEGDVRMTKDLLLKQAEICDASASFFFR